MTFMDKISKNALGIAMLTATANPRLGLFRRITAIVETPSNVIYDFGERTIKTIANYTELSDLLGILSNAEHSVIPPMQNISQNISDDPYKVLYVGLIAYLACKAILPTTEFIFDRGTKRPESGLEKLGKSLEKK